MARYDAFFERALHRLRDFRLSLPNPTFGNPGWEAAGFHVLVVRLSPFSDVERSTPHLLLASEVRAALTDAYIDMAFLPHRQDAALIEEAGLPLLLGTQSHRSLDEFDLALVSNSWLLEEVNLPFLLAHSGIPLWARERGEEWPPILLGGSSATAAHALVSETGDSIPDAFFFGEGEEAIGRIAALCRDGAGLPKADRIAVIAAGVPGIRPGGSLSGASRKARVSADHLAARGAALPAVLPGPEAGTVRLSITRGCPCLCSFCFEGFDRKPFRELPASALVAMADALKRSTGADTIEVDSFTFTAHSEIATLLVELHRRFLHVNLMSQRVDVLARTPGLLDLEILAGKASFTLGIEGISAAMRAFLHKSLPSHDIRTALEALHERRTREIKLFFMLTGREGAADTAEFASFVSAVKEMRARAASRPRIVFSFGLLVRMPFTPLRHDAPLLEESAWKQIVGKVKSICETNGFEFRLALSWPDYAATQVLALGGHSLDGLLLQLAGEEPMTSAPMPSRSRATVEEWIRTHREELAAEKGPGWVFGFPFLDDGATRAMLHRQYERAKIGRDVGYGLSPERRPMDTGAIAAAAHTLAPMMEKKRRLQPVFAVLPLAREAAGMGTRWAEAYLLRSLLDRFPEQAANILAVREALIDPLGILPADMPWFGLALCAITAWDAAGLSAALGDSLLLRVGTVPPRSIRVRLTLPAAFFPDPAASLAAFLRDHHAPVTMVRTGAVFRFSIQEKAMKKRMLLAGACSLSGPDHVLDLTVGIKPFLGAWLDGSPGPGASRRGLAEIVGMD
jgi:hypothetical protein